MNKTIYAIIIVLLIAIGYIGLSQRSATPAQVPESPATGVESPAPAATTSTPAPEAPAATPEEPAAVPAPSGISMAEVARHADATSCYTVVGENVYDVTSWIAQHPGGRQAILGLCGKDGTAAFTKQHGGQRKAEQALANFRIAALAH